MKEPLTSELVLHAYRRGFFPMAEPDGEIAWYSPDPRCVFEFDTFHVPATLRKTIRRGLFDVRIDTAFREVVTACGARAEGTWISDEIIDLYCDLHARGVAHSVESWRDDELAGGLYGVALGGAFFGESMFHRVTDASKVALVALMDRLKARGFVLVDTQWNTPHLSRFGSIEIPREEYLRRLRQALKLTCAFGD